MQINQEIKQTIETYSRFLKERLQPDFDTIQGQIEQLNYKVDAQKRLKQSLEEIDCESFETVVDMGEKILMSAIVPNTLNVFIEVGFGFHVDMNRYEACEFLVQSIELIERKVKLKEEQAQYIQGQIKVVEHTLDQIVHLENLPLE